MKYQKYANKFVDRPRYFSNCLRAFISGGIVCETGYFLQSLFLYYGLDNDTAGIWSTIILICVAQLLTGLGCYDNIARIGGAGVIVPITGFANSVVSPAMEFKKEGPVLGAGSRIFSLAGPVILLGIATSWVVGIIYWILMLL